MGTGGTKPPRLTTSPIATLPGDSGSMLKTARTALANLRKPWLAQAQFIGITEPSSLESTHFATETRLAWISTERNSPHTMPAETPILESFRPWDYYAKRCADSPISRRHLARRLHDSGHFRDPRGEKRLGRALYRCTDLPNDWREIPES